MAPAERVEERAPLDFTKLFSHFPTAIAEIRAAQLWNSKPFAPLQVDREILNRSLTLGTHFLLRHQTPAGNFHYTYDWIAGEWIEDDSLVRQAGSLWGVALINLYRATEQTRMTLERGLRFWFRNTVDAPNYGLTVKYKSDRVSSTGTVALVALAIIEYLRARQTIDEGFKQAMLRKLDGYLRHLTWLQLESGHFATPYHLTWGSRSENSNPYFDGETLLCLIKAARYLKHRDLLPVIQKAARAMAEKYTVQAWRRYPDSKQTKGFYQWGSMAFAEYYQTQWQDYELYGDVTLALAWWMIHTHETLRRRRNHAYCYVQH